MMQQHSHNQGQSIWTSLSLLWDGIYNVDHIGEIITPPIHPIDAQTARYDCAKRSLKIHSNNRPLGEQTLDISGCGDIAVRIGNNSEIDSFGVAASFIPYEKNLVIPIQIRSIEQINTLLFRVYRCFQEKGDKDQEKRIGHRLRKDDTCLVYQEIFDQLEISCLDSLDTPILEETHADFSNRIANYWGVEDFANWYHHTYCVEVWVSIRPGEFAGCNGDRNPELSVGKTVHNKIVDDFCDNHILACDDLNYNYNFQRSSGYFKWLNDFSRVQRLLRNQRVFFEHLRHIEDYLAAQPNAELLEPLEFFENQAQFPTTQAIPLGVLSSSSFSELVTRAYAIYDVGVRSCHGGLTHRLQWHGIIRLMTSEHTVAIAKGFYYSALELYCTVRGSLFETTNRSDAEFKIDLWRFLFDRFDKYSTSDGLQSSQFVQYPERYEDELHYAEQFHMATLDLSQDIRIVQKYITDLSAQNGESTSTSVLISRLLNGDSSVPSKLHNWIERYLDQLTLPLKPDYAGDTADERLRWGCMIRVNEWAETEEVLNNRRIHLHNLVHLASKLRSFFIEALVAVQVISELRNMPELIPYMNPHRHAILRPVRPDRSLLTVIEEIAPYARILRLLSQIDDNKNPLFIKMKDDKGNDIECLKRTKTMQLSQQTIDMLKLKSRVELNLPQVNKWTMEGVPFP